MTEPATEPPTEPTTGQHPLDPEPPRPPGAPDVDLEIPVESRSGGAATPGNEDTAEGAASVEPPD